MTDIRVTSYNAPDWLYCPRCGKRLELDQEPDAIVGTADGGDVDVELSQEAGFSFSDSLSHCGYHIRVWQADSCYAESLE